MAYPYWVTEAGDLGTIQEQEFFNIQLEGRDPEQPTNNTGLVFELLAGNLPGGIALAFDGIITGTPLHRRLVKGVPYEVGEDITSTFVVRITDNEGLIADRTFSLTVTGPDSPIWVTSAGDLGDYHDGTKIDIALSVIDTDQDVLEFYVSSGALPPGLSLDSATGTIKGVIEKIGITKEYNFVIAVTDGVFTVDRNFSITVHAVTRGTTDREQDDLGNNITADSTWNMWLADVYLFIRPRMLTTQDEIGEVRHGSFYINEFFGFLGEELPTIEFEQIGNVPNGFTFIGDYETNAVGDQTGSSLLYGIIPTSSASESEYTFSIRPKTSYTDPDYVELGGKLITIYGEYENYVLTVRGELSNEVVWSLC